MRTLRIFWRRGGAWAGVALLSPAWLAGAARPVRSATGIGLENGAARVVFDARSGQLVSLYNAARADEYLKDRRDDGGPFTVYADSRGEFDIGAQGWGMRMAGDPDSLAGSRVGAADCRLLDSSFRRAGEGLALQLSYQDAEARWRIDLEVWLADEGGASDWGLSITNLRPDPATMMAAFPDISGFRLGTGNANMQTTLREGGGITPAWTRAGGIYGNGGQMSMQWHALFDRESGVYFGLIAADAELRNKWFRMVKPRIQVLYFPPETLAARGKWRSPRSRLMIGEGDWKPVARAYRDWFGAAFRMAERPGWADGLDSWMGAWFAKKGGILPPGGCEGTARCLDSFADLPENYRQRPVDLHEYAFHTRGSARDSMVHTDGDNVLRDDLGGAAALREGIAGVHKLGYRFAFYIEGYIVHQSSELAKSGRAQRWSVMHQDGTITGSYTKAGFYHMCPGAVEWQDHLAEVASRLVRETGADGVRLDSLGFYFLACYHPAHRHATPFGYNLWIQQLLDKVSRAVRAVNPECVLTTEAPVDFYSQWFHGALHLTWTIGRELPPMRIALPDYRPFIYQGVGPLYGSLSGLPGGSNGYEGRAGLRELDENWRALRHGVARTLLRGDVADQDPEPSLPDVTCRRFNGSGHSVIVCARVGGAERWNFPKEMRLAEEHRPFTVRVKGVQKRYDAAAFYDLEKATVAPWKVRAEGGDLVIPVETSNWFMAVLREPGGPALAAIRPIAEARAGDSRPVAIDLLTAPATKKPMAAALSARGLTFAGGEARIMVEVPGIATLVVPPGTPPGRYQVQLDGEGLIGMKRFVVVGR